MQRLLHRCQSLGVVSLRGSSICLARPETLQRARHYRCSSRPSIMVTMHALRYAQVSLIKAEDASQPALKKTWPKAPSISPPLYSCAIWFTGFYSGFPVHYRNSTARAGACGIISLLAPFRTFFVCVCVDNCASKD